MQCGRSWPTKGTHTEETPPRTGCLTPTEARGTAPGDQQRRVRSGVHYSQPTTPAQGTLSFHITSTNTTNTSTNTTPPSTSTVLPFPATAAATVRVGEAPSDDEGVRRVAPGATAHGGTTGSRRHPHYPIYPPPTLPQTPTPTPLLLLHGSLTDPVVSSPSPPPQ